MRGSSGTLGSLSAHSWRPQTIARALLGSSAARNEHEGVPVANIKSQMKRIRTNEKARQRNKAVKSSLKTAVRRFHEAAQAGDTEKAQEYARAAARQLDKAASKGVIHKNQAANRKSAIQKQAASL